MHEIHERLFIGSDIDCRNGSTDLAVVHACKHPCHTTAVGYQGSLPREHPNYLVLRQPNDLYLNMIDPAKPLFMPPLFSSFFEFAQAHWSNGSKVLIHCNKGESRAPTLALLFLAKHVGAISAESFEKAREEFSFLYPAYQPGTGIKIYVTQNWSTL